LHVQQLKKKWNLQQKTATRTTTTKTNLLALVKPTPRPGDDKEGTVGSFKASKKTPITVSLSAEIILGVFPALFFFAFAFLGVKNAAKLAILPRDLPPKFRPHCAQRRAHSRRFRWTTS